MTPFKFCRPLIFFFREEDILSDLTADYFDNAPCIELLTCQVIRQLLCCITKTFLLNYSLIEKFWEAFIACETRTLSLL